MATPFLQKARQRKMIYFGAIAVLFTVSLIHREFLLKPQAFALQLRESARGEVELTSSAVRLMLTGSRGFAVTMLWYTAMDKQKRSEWNELELLVKSITKLQPHFVTPWLFQSWNIAFNVAVECDRPRDKYYYISRGLELLYEGERRNRGAGDDVDASDPNKVYFPGNPDLRYYMGFMYQLKIGNSDERLTMRSLLELSCIDPVERNPDLFRTTNERGQKQVRLKEFAQFTQKYPRLVRRLREQLGYTDPDKIVQFLQDNERIPNRFKSVEKSAHATSTLTQSELKAPHEQFPLLPPAEGSDVDPRKHEFTNESVDVFLVCRSWYEYAMKPLPPPNPRPGPKDADYDKTRYRIPKQMMSVIFRGYPARAQVYIAEMLGFEGWFDSDGWIVQDWFDPLAASRENDFFDDEGKFVVGQQAKYHSGAAWEKGYQAYRKYGLENGLYLEPATRAALEQRAQLIRKELKLDPSATESSIPADWKQGERGLSADAHLRLYYHDTYGKVTNFDAFYYQSEGERDVLTVCMRKTLFQAERRYKSDPSSEQTLALFDQAWRLYVHTCLKHPRFAQVETMQEDLYESYQVYLRDQQKEYKSEFKQAALTAAQFAPEATPSWAEAIVRTYVMKKVAGEPAQMNKVIPIRIRRGSLDAVRYYDPPSSVNDLRNVLFLWSQGATAAMQPNFTASISYPGHHYFLLSQANFRDEPLPPHWSVLINDEVRRVVGERPGQKR